MFNNFVQCSKFELQTNSYLFKSLHHRLLYSNSCNFQNFKMNRLFQIPRRFLSEKALEAYASPVYRVTSPSNYVLHVELDRPEAKNTMDMDVWFDLKKIMDTADNDPKVRAVVFSAVTDTERPVFSAGIDIGGLTVKLMECMEQEDGARRFFKVRQMIKDFQDPISSIEKCKKPVIAAVSGAAVGGAIDLLSACDIRYCDKDAWFSIKEVDVGLAADVGTLRSEMLVGLRTQVILEVFRVNFSAKESIFEKFQLF